MDASHFRQRAAVARELAQVGDDRRLAQMLMELAIDLEEEAEAIEAEQATAEKRRPQPAGATADSNDRAAARIFDLTLGGMKPPMDTRPGRFSAVVLPFPGCDTRQESVVTATGARDTAAAPDSRSRAAPPQSRSADKRADGHADACTLLTMN